VQTLVHCCNWLLTETQCKIILVQHVCRPKLFKNLCLSLVSGVPHFFFRTNSTAFSSPAFSVDRQEARSGDKYNQVERRRRRESLNCRIIDGDYGRRQRVVAVVVAVVYTVCPKKSEPLNILQQQPEICSDLKKILHTQDGICYKHY